uniref:Protein ultraspiracle (inferred by orthology to a D. melanogaster protein) n=1 Tax=Strongyloides venezuelensis TaxID=75913 RepID=A0A0K0F2I5_STRVS
MDYNLYERRASMPHNFEYSNPDDSYIGEEECKVNQCMENDNRDICQLNQDITIPLSTSVGNIIQTTRPVDKCRVCGDSPARMHYGVPTCFGCKGFFRRTLKRTKDYVCRYQGTCIVDRHERNSCRFCRFKKCLEVGMDPKAVRPDRDMSLKGAFAKSRKSIKSQNNLTDHSSTEDEFNISNSKIVKKSEWIHKIPSDMRQLLNYLVKIESMTTNGDSSDFGVNLYPLSYSSIRSVLEDPSILVGKRTEMKYQTTSQVRSEEIRAVAHRNLIDIIDWVEQLSHVMDIRNTNDKLLMIKSSYAPLAIFSFSAFTSRSTKDTNLVCLCNYGCVPRDVDILYDDPYHLANKIIQRSLDELVEPFRSFNFTDEEIILMKAIIVLNPHIKGLTTETAEVIADFRDRVHETLYHIIQETHPRTVTSSRFGNMLLFVPTVLLLGNVMYDNLKMIEIHGAQPIDPMMHELLETMEIVTCDNINLNIDDIRSCSNGPKTEQYKTMNNSWSNCSILSMNSQYSESSYNTSYQNVPISRSSSSVTEATVQRSESCDFFDCNFSNIASSSLECDPDYNVTLTQNMVSPEMAQMIRSTSQNSNQQPKGNESNCQSNNNISINNSNPNYPDYQKPLFYIENNSSPYNNDNHYLSNLTPTTIQSPVGGSKNTRFTKFTVTKSNLPFDNSYPNKATMIAPQSNDIYQDSCRGTFDYYYGVSGDTINRNGMINPIYYNNNMYQRNEQDFTLPNQSIIQKSQSFHNYSYDSNNINPIMVANSMNGHAVNGFMNEAQNVSTIMDYE